MNNELFNDLADLAKEKKAVEARYDAKKEEVMAYMASMGMKSWMTGRGAYSVATRTSYEYSPAIQGLEIAMKRAKRDEEENGKAVSRETTFLQFKPLGGVPVVEEPARARRMEKANA